MRIPDLPASSAERVTLPPSQAVVHLRFLITFLRISAFAVDARRVFRHRNCYRLFANSFVKDRQQGREPASVKAKAQILTAVLAATVQVGAGSMPLAAQYLPSYGNAPQAPAQNAGQSLEMAVPAPTAAQQAVASPNAVSPDVQRLLAFRESDVKFDIGQMMEILRDKRHEGWVLTAYPDPKTGQPLIGAGFSLDLPAREHAQSDPLNPNQFLEPSSAELWQAAGLAPERLQSVLNVFHSRLDSWSKEGFRSQMTTLEPQITERDANALLRVGAIQAALNAKAYCRYFNGLTASQQMGLAQLVYQMGVNMQEFTTFLGLMNRQSTDELGNTVAVRPGPGYWSEVQKSLIDSRWARLYRERAAAVVAMFDPRYAGNPAVAERRVNAVLNPPRRRGRAGRTRRDGAVREADLKQRHSTAARKRAAKKRRD